MTLYLVTGGAGFIGSHLVEALLGRGDRVRVLDDLSTGRRANLEPFGIGRPGSGSPLELVEGDLSDRAALERALPGVQGIFHEAAQVSVPLSVEAPERSLEVNAMGTLRLLEGARRAGVQGLVFAASSAAYGNNPTLPKHEDLPPEPLSPYAIGKLVGEQLLAVYGQLHGLRTVSLRYFNIFGPRQLDDSPYTGVIAIFARRLLAGQPIEIHGDGEQTRDFTFVANAVRANLLAMQAALDGRIQSGRVYNVGAGERTSVNQLYRELARLAGVGRQPTYAPSRAGDVRHSFASLERIQRELGYRPEVGFADGLARTFEWYRARFRST
jgi:nucleoside-diphosphate-sugar epimerase